MGEDDPYSEVYYRLMELLYDHHPVRTRVAGTVESIADITPEVLYRCHRAFYRPGNMVLCVAGSVDAERVRAIAEEVLSKEYSTATDSDLGQPEGPLAARHFSEKRMEVSMPLFELGIKGEPAVEGRRLRQQLVAELACDALMGPSSRLYNRLYEEGLINGSFSAGYEAVPGAAWLMAGGDSRDPERVRDEILKEARQLAEEGIDPDLWERLVRAAYGSMVRRLNSLEDTCISMAQATFDGDDYFHFPELFQSIEREDAEELLRTWCVPERAALSVIRPLTEDET